MKESNILASENFSCGNKHYFLDFRIAKNNSNYISITRSDSQPDGSYAKQTVRVFEEDFHILLGCMSSLFRTVAYQDEQGVTMKDMHRRNREKAVNGIKSWEPELRPREKMLEHGREAMDNAELLAMLIGSGTPNETAVGLAGRMLDNVGGDLVKLSELSLKELCGFAGMGVAKSSSILAAMELARRMYPMLNVSPIRKMRVSSGVVMRPAMG
ncbi:UPF0758 domain-containing protein [Pedobacter sp.]